MEFTRKDTKAIKGIAIILMLLHHLAGFPERLPEGFQGFQSLLWKGFVNDGYLGALAISCKLCVALFFFLGGYGIYKRYETGNFRVSSAIMSLYKSYWKVFCIFIPLCFIFLGHADRGNIFNSFETKRHAFTEIINNFLGFNNSFNGEWWFFTCYMCSIPVGFLFCKLIQKNDSFLVDMAIVIAAEVLIGNFFLGFAGMPAFSSLNDSFFYTRFFNTGHHMSIVFTGIVFAKYDKIAEFKKIFSRLRFKALFGFIGCVLVLYMRWFCMGDKIDLIYSAVFTVSASIMLDGFKPAKKAATVLGQFSTNMWLCHSFFCYYFYGFAKNVIYCTRNVWMDLLILVLVSLTASIFMEALYKGLSFILPFLKKIFIIPEESAKVETKPLKVEESIVKSDSQ